MSRQQGQAMFEMLIVSAAIMVLLFGLIWLQRWQQIKVQTQHHAALQAFRFSQSFELGSNQNLSPEYMTGLYSAIPHQQHSQSTNLGVMPHQASLLNVAQQEGVLGGSARWRFESRAMAAGVDQLAAWQNSSFSVLPEMQVQSQTSIWVGAGHALSDAQMTQRLQGSRSLWRHASGASQASMGLLTPLLQPVELGWGRPAPTTNWLQPWQESVPGMP